MHTNLVELQEANKDVLLGKRKLNCLSCGTEKNKDSITVGQDGKVYRVVNAMNDGELH